METPQAKPELVCSECQRPLPAGELACPYCGGAPMAKDYKPEHDPSDELAGTSLDTAIQRFLSENYGLVAQGDDWAHLRKYGNTGLGWWLFDSQMAWLIHRTQEEQTISLYTDDQGLVWAKRSGPSKTTKFLWTLLLAGPLLALLIMIIMILITR